MSIDLCADLERISDAAISATDNGAWTEVQSGHRRGQLIVTVRGLDATEYPKQGDFGERIHVQHYGSSASLILTADGEQWSDIVAELVNYRLPAVAV
ncbi:hypothetical protein ACN95_14445 [Gordonia sihwensis]|uniref:hypothetical protein n=1 Tax=Gordonia sihwensis TaxID=173559 RepID=UPI001C92E34F|nr:hypothetical protein [Gordonia sihwensis]MBY4571216.1 hypothetical protein [Gordonia sihwensis]